MFFESKLGICSNLKQYLRQYVLHDYTIQIQLRNVSISKQATKYMLEATMETLEKYMTYFQAILNSAFSKSSRKKLVCKIVYCSVKTFSISILCNSTGVSTQYNFLSRDNVTTFQPWKIPEFVLLQWIKTLTNFHRCFLFIWLTP